MKWKTPVLDEISGQYRINSESKHRILDDDERDWLLEKNVRGHNVPENPKVKITTYIGYIILPKPLAVEFMLMFGDKS